MRYTAEHKQATHTRILAAAEKLFRAEGFSGASVERVMRAAGLTVGGFYAHFASKESLLAETLRAFMEERKRRWLAGLEGLRGPAFLDHFARRYLSLYNRDTGQTSCMMPSLLSDLTRAPPEVQAAFSQGLDELVDAAQGQLPAREGATPRQQMLATVALCFGAMTLARATGSHAVSAELLDAARALLLAGAPVEEAGAANGDRRRRADRPAPDAPAPPAGTPSAGARPANAAEARPPRPARKKTARSLSAGARPTNAAEATARSSPPVRKKKSPRG
ncbi:TetR/AcrR family transcriptional regulator [Corallococcus soli]|uniref:TetR/AcrR family transcriptional regulator n=1 Tax=Corallococcus soli TaxID=2710757 RepID=UPI001D0428C0|nr:TetR/AcrR family transcriptional regulator [Corallococcus soli]